MIDHVRPGAHFTRTIRICNGTGHAQSVTLYPAAATIAGGSFGPAQDPHNELTQWIRVSPTSLTLPPNVFSTATADFTVPADATAGERYAVIYAALPPQRQTGGIAVVSRAGVRVYLDVGAGGAPKIDFTVDTLTARRDTSGRPIVEAEVHNTGGRAIDLSGQLKLSDGPGGLSAGPFPAKLGTTLAPGQTEPVTVVLDKSLPSGPWHARIDLQSDLIKRAAEGTIKFPSQAGTSAAPVKAKNISLAKNRNFLVPVAILLLLGIAVGIFLLFWKRRKRKDDEEEEKRRS